MASASRDELRTVAVFHDLPDEQLGWFLEHATEVRWRPAMSTSHAGDPADRMMVVLEGEMQARFEGRSKTYSPSRRGTVDGSVCRTRA